jgi:hypothetical protein|tara:strand:+ start:288 stop:617 length:330 start_codon:yes stop_codon:yes gene_type:complete
MEITGKLIKVLDLEQGTSKAGKEWRKQSIIVQTDAEFNNEVCISAFGQDKITDMNKLQIDDKVTILCNIYSREYKGRYFNSIDGYWFTKAGSKKTNDEFVTVDDNDMPF